ncbi:MAG TPA: redox-sensitive transcriptional activator SoxR [Acidimicrobiales bacterium]
MLDEDDLSIGTVAERAGLAVSAVRYYEEQGLIVADRGPGGHRRFRRGVLRRLALIQVAQKVGLSIEEIKATLAELPQEVGPTGEEWVQMSKAWRPLLDERIRILTALRDQLDSCIGCGCLSLERCRLSNPSDRAGKLGAGPRYLLGDAPEPAG